MQVVPIPSIHSKPIILDTSRPTTSEMIYGVNSQTNKVSEIESSLDQTKKAKDLLFPSQTFAEAYDKLSSNSYNNMLRDGDQQNANNNILHSSNSSREALEHNLIDNRLKTVYTIQRKSKSIMLSEAKGTRTREYKGVTYDNLYYDTGTNMPGSFYKNIQKKTIMLNRIASRGQ